MPDRDVEYAFSRNANALFKWKHITHFETSRIVPDLLVFPFDIWNTSLLLNRPNPYTNARQYKIKREEKTH